MEQTSFTERLMEFGLTRQEASIYQCLLTEGKVTGYEVAKQTGISRSNAYNSLASMTEKGAAYLVEEASTRKYVPVPLNEFCKNRIRKLEESGKWLQEHMPTEKAYVEGYITIEGAENILNKIKNLLSQVDQRVYISCTRNYLLLLIRELDTLMEEEFFLFQRCTFLILLYPCNRFRYSLFHRIRKLFFFCVRRLFS